MKGLLKKKKWVIFFSHKKYDFVNIAYVRGIQISRIPDLGDIFEGRIASVLICFSGNLSAT